MHHLAVLPSPRSREDVKEARAGDIVAIAGLKDVVTGDTLCDEKAPVLLERMEFPDPVIKVCSGLSVPWDGGVSVGITSGLARGSSCDACRVVASCRAGCLLGLCASPVPASADCGRPCSTRPPTPSGGH